MVGAAVDDGAVVAVELGAGWVVDVGAAVVGGAVVGAAVVDEVLGGAVVGGAVLAVVDRIVVMVVVVDVSGGVLLEASLPATTTT